MPTGQSPAMTTAAASRVPVGDRARLGERRRGHLAARPIGRLELRRERLGLGHGGRQQQLRGRLRVAHPATGVQARRDDVADRLEVDALRRHLRRGQQRGQPGPGRAAQQLQPQARDGPVLADHRRHVGDRADRRQVGQRECRGGAAGPIGEQQLGHLEGHAGAGQARIGVEAPRPVGIDDRDRIGEPRGHVVMVGDDDVDAGHAGGRDLGHARRAGVHRDDERASLGPGALHGRQRQAVTLGAAIGHVRRRVQAERTERDDHDGQAGQTVGVEVAEDEHALGRIERSRDARPHGRRVGQQPRVVQGRGRRVEEGGQVPGSGVATGGQDVQRPLGQATPGAVGEEGGLDVAGSRGAASDGWGGASSSRPRMPRAARPRLTGRRGRSSAAPGAAARRTRARRRGAGSR